MKYNKYDYIISHFIANGFAVFAQDHHLYIETEKTTLKIPKHYCEQKYADNLSNTDLGLGTDSHYQNFIATISMQEILPSFDVHFHFQDTESVCLNCKGSGVVSCQCCGSHIICDKCKGEGKIFKENERLIQGVTSYVSCTKKIRNQEFYSSNLELIIFTMLVLGVEKCSYFEAYGNTALFQFGGIVIRLSEYTNHN